MFSRVSRVFSRLSSLPSVRSFHSAQANRMTALKPRILPLAFGISIGAGMIMAIPESKAQAKSDAVDIEQGNGRLNNTQRENLPPFISSLNNLLIFLFLLFVQVLIQFTFILILLHSILIRFNLKILLFSLVVQIQF
jgi:hypothetical protein